ncbi:hypothetical protein JCM6882_000706 [Rhodosporidiobolus microsporus]
MAPPSSRSRAPFPSILISLLLLALGTAHHRTAASPEPAALAPRPPRPDHLNPNLLPPHLRQKPAPAPLPEAIAAFRFNAPPREPAQKPEETAEEVDDGFELSPLVLAVSVDGQVHALNRDTGQWKWTLHDDGGAATGRKDGRRVRNPSDKAYGGPLVRSVSRRKKPAGGASAGGAGRADETGVVPVDADDDDNDETYIIEPSGSGDIYVYSRSTGGLDKLPLSMQELVALSPFRFPGHESRMFSASKHTRFVGVDLRTGRLVGVFGSNAGWCEWDETDELTGGRDLDCEEDIDKRPEDLLYMARTEYELSIYDTTSALPLQVLSYTTYTSSTLPQPLTSNNGAPYPSQTTWTRTPDSLYHQPMPDGALVCFRAGQPGVHWSLDFDTPVVSVFDVVVPPPSEPGDARQHPIMFEQPHPLLVPDLPLDFAVLQQEPAAAFVGRIAAPSEKGGEKRDELFAMSRDRFPLVPFAQMAEAAKQNVNVPAAGLGEDVKEGGDDGWTEAPELCRGVDCIIGRHRLRNPPPPSPVHLDATIDPPPSSEPLLIDARPSSDDPSPSSPHAHPAGTPNRRTPHYPGSSTLLASLYKSTARELRALGPQEAGGGKFTFGVLLLVVAAWFWTKSKGKKAPASAAQGGKVKFAAKQKGKNGAANGGRSRRSSAEDSLEEEEELPATPTDEQDLRLAPARQEAGKGHRKAGSTGGGGGRGKGASAGGGKQAGDGVRRRSPSTPPTPTSLGVTLTQPPLNGTSASSSPARTRSSSLSLAPALPIVSPLKELPPLPPSADDADDVDPASLSSSAAHSVTSSPPVARDGFDDGADSDSPPTGAGGDISTPPRKRNRRRRGAKKKKQKDPSATSLDEEFGAALGEGGEGEKDAALERITLSERETRDEDDSPSPPSTGGESAQVDADGKGVDGESVAAEAPASIAVVAGETPRTAKLDEQLVGGLAVSETIIGYGSHGTVVLRGEFQGRAVAVKRLLKDFVTIAAHEVNLLQESDDHPHVIRYFCKEQRETFLYIALELCPASLFDLIDQPAAFPDLVGQLDPKKALKQITSGLRHLHSLKIVHRDIKPQNILVSTAKRGRGQGGLRMLISDFGLCKKLDVDESSFQQTVNHAAGSFGYRAPEVLRGLVDPNEAANGGAGPMSPSASIGSGGSTNTLAGSSNGGSTDPSMRLTRSIDVFSLGCIFYYVLTRGEHPFGGRYEREMNILQGKVSLERLDGLGEEAVEVQDLIARMVATDPRERPAADNVLLHPFFWNAQKRLLFICDASDRFEIMERDPPTPTLVTLERRSRDIVGDDWSKALDRTLLDNLGKYRKYDGASVRDLLRVLRNKKHHYQDLPETVRRNLGDLPGGFLSYFTARFPHLLLHVYDTVATHLSDEAMFASTFRIPEDDA